VTESAFEGPEKTKSVAASDPIAIRSDPPAVAFLKQNQAVAAAVDADTILVMPGSADSPAVLSHELAHIVQLRSGRKASREAAERAALAYAQGVRDDPGGAAEPPLFNDGKGTPQGPPQADLFGDEDFDIVINDEDITTPAVTKSGGRRYIEGHRVPNKSANTPKPTTRRLDAEDVVRRPNETRAQAMTRVRTVLGRRISETPFVHVWNAVVDRLSHGMTPAALGRDRVLSIYARAQGQFWEAVAQDSELVHYLQEAGIDFEPGHIAPLVQVSDTAAIPWYERKLNLDHLREKAIGDNYLLALDPTNLAFETQGANQYREAKQARIPELRAPVSTPAETPVPENFVEDPTRIANDIASQPLVLQRGNRAVEAVINHELYLGGPAGTLAEQRARRRTGVWREAALPEVDPSEFEGLVVQFPAQVGFEPFLPVSTPPENEFVLAGDKYGLTIVDPGSETLIRIVEEQDRYGPNMISYPPKLETEEELFGHTETPAIAYQLLPPQDGKPGEVRIVVGPGAFIEISEPAPQPGMHEWELEFMGTHLGGTYDVTIIEMPDNNLVPLPNEKIDVEKLLAAGGERRQPDKHQWRGAISYQDEVLFWGEVVAMVAFALIPFGFELLEAVSLAEVVAAGNEAADLSALAVGEVPGPGAAGIGEGLPVEGGFFETPPGVDVTPPPDEGPIPQGVSVTETTPQGRYGVDYFEKSSWVDTEEADEAAAEQQQHVYVQVKW
jgi:hypothetical protein